MRPLAWCVRSRTRHLRYGALDALLAALPGSLAPGGVAVVLTFHSGEDRRVKKAFKDGLAAGLFADVARRPLRPSAAEANANPRSRCCKLRWAVRAETAKTAGNIPPPPKEGAEPPP